MKSRSTRIAGICAIVVGCAVASGALQAGMTDGGGKREGYVSLDGIAVAALVPAGWTCHSSTSSGKESSGVLRCISVNPSSSMISLLKISETKAPTSLESYLEQALSQQPKGLPGDMLPLIPRMIQVGPRKAVESASTVKTFYNAVDGNHSQSDSVLHTILLAHASAYYECSLSTTPVNYTAGLQKTLVQFCASIRFDDANPSSGKH